MNVFVRAVITGFGYSLGSSLYKKLSQRFEGDDSSEKSESTAPNHPVPADKQAADQAPDDSDSPDSDSPNTDNTQPSRND